jgi:hypothetical protein
MNAALDVGLQPQLLGVAVTAIPPEPPEDEKLWLWLRESDGLEIVYEHTAPI